MNQKRQRLYRDPTPIVEVRQGLLKKKDGTIRICTNLIALNTIVQIETSIMTDLIVKVAGAEYISVIDLKDGYFQVEVAEADRKKATFKFEIGVECRWDMKMPRRFFRR